MLDGCRYSNCPAISECMLLMRPCRWRSVLRLPDDGYTSDAAHFEGNVQRLSTWLALHLGWMDLQFTDVSAGNDTATALPAATAANPFASVFAKVIGMMG